MVKTKESFLFNFNQKEFLAIKDSFPWDILIPFKAIGTAEEVLDIGFKLLALMLDFTLWFIAHSTHEHISKDHLSYKNLWNALYIMRSCRDYWCAWVPRDDEQTHSLASNKAIPVQQTDTFSSFLSLVFVSVHVLHEHNGSSLLRSIGLWDS